MKSTMEILKPNKGITVVALVITIIILLIIAGVSIYTGGDEIKTAKSNSAKTQLSMVQHAVLERYTEYKVTKNEAILVGEALSGNSEVTASGFTPKATDGYYKLSKEDLEEMGIQEEEDTYIVNYKTGEAMNITQTTTVLGDTLYIDASN